MTGLERTGRRRQAALRAAWVPLAAFVAACSLVPPGSTAKRIIDSTMNDKLGHAAAYFSLALLPALHEPRRIWLAQTAAALLMGLGLEVAQALFTSRAFEATDIAANAVGVWAALVAARYLRPKLAPWLLGRPDPGTPGPGTNR